MRTLFIILVVLLPAIAVAHKPDLKHLPKSRSGAFIENAGQIVDQDGNRRTDIDFKLSTTGITVFVGDGNLHYQWYKVTSATKPTDYFGDANRLQDLAPDTIATYRMDVILQGVNTHAEVIKEEQQLYYENYYLPQCPDGAKAHSFQKITYKNIYPNIDWILYTDHKENGRLKYDFVVHAGGDIHDIQLRYDGTTALAMHEGALTATTPFGSITEKAPYSYERETGKTITSAFMLKGDVLSFNAAAHKGTLVIDPEIEWATYYGGSEWESNSSAKSIATDLQGNIHMIGSSWSTNNIATTGSFQDTLIGHQDGYVVRFDTYGIRKWATYYGGKNGLSRASTNFIAITANNGIYIAGNTHAMGLATPGTHKEVRSPAQGSVLYFDVIIIKMDTLGQRNWATYYGGIDGESAMAIAADDDGNTYITGGTGSEYGISKGNVHQTTIGTKGVQNVYLAKFSPTGQQIWGTYLGTGNSLSNPYIGNNNYGSAIAVHKGKELYIAGTTSHSARIATSGVHSEVLNTDTTFRASRIRDDGFLTKFDTGGKQIWGTYFGGTGNDQIYGLSIDRDGYAYIAGATDSKEKIATAGSFMPQISYPEPQISDGFISKFTPQGKQVWGTYYGGENRDIFNGLALDSHGDICLTGLSESTTGIATAGAWKPTYNSTENSDGIFVKFDRNGNRLWGTYYGSDTIDYTTGISADSNGIVFISGVTYGQTSIATPGAHQQILGGAGDNFLIKSISDSVVLYIEQTFDDTVICYNSKGAHVNIDYIVSGSFRAGNVFTAELSDANGNFTSPTIIGTKAGTASGYIYCTLPNNLARTKGYRIRVLASAPYYVSNDNGIDIELRDGSEHPVITGDTALCAGEDLRLNATSATNGVSFKWAGPNGYATDGADITRTGIAVGDSGSYIVSVSPFECRTNDTVNVKVLYTPKVPTISHNAPLCEGDTLVFEYEKDQDTTVFYAIGWPNPNANFGDGIITDRATQQHNGKYVVVATKEPCKSVDSTEIKIYPAPRFDITTNSPLKAGQDLKLSVKEDSSVSNYTWTGPDDFSSTDRGNIIPNVSAFNAGVYYISGTKGGCTGTDSVEVVVNEGEDFLILFPNPNNGQFTLRGNFKNEHEMQLRVVNAAGQLVYKESFKTIRRQVNRSITLPAVASGVYTLHLRYPGASKSIPFTITR